MTYFVKYHGDLEKDPLDRGVKDFTTPERAESFAEKMRNKGLTATVYTGIMDSKVTVVMANDFPERVLPGPPEEHKEEINTLRTELNDTYGPNIYVRGYQFRI